MNIAMTEPLPQVRLKNAWRSSHPWIFQKLVDKPAQKPRPGEIVDAFDVEAAKTSALVEKLAGFELGRRPLIVTEDASENLFLSARNLPYVQVRDVQGLDPVALVGADTVVITSDAVKKIEEWLA